MKAEAAMQISPGERNPGKQMKGKKWLYDEMKEPRGTFVDGEN